MHLKRLRIENFRALEKIDVEFDTRVSVIIGPNAIGKTTVLEAIRLAKAILAPRTQNETNQVLQSLGAFSPHLPQRLFGASLTTKPSQPVLVKCAYEVAATDMAKIQSMSDQLIATMAQQSAGMVFSSPAQQVAFLGSPQGRRAYTMANRILQPELVKVQSGKRLELNLTIDVQSGNISGEYPIQQLMFAALDGALTPDSTLFSYFPADRALPTGEQPVQLGIGDTVNQLESYNSQPQLKYQRLKNLIFNTIISASSGREKLEEQFKSIFETVLQGRALGDIGVNALGMLSIPIRDIDSGIEFQIDGLSSGEKGLLLTFLLIAQTVAEDGVVLLDEPELHLNPAVCRHLLEFLADEYAEKHRIQAIICSHSAEILAGTFERRSCSLFHLRNGTTLAKVRYQDQGEIRDALRRLGSSETEALLYKGTVSVEGIHDIELLQVGFDDLFRRFRIRERGGRTQIQKDIEEPQRAERRGEDIGNYYFIFDLDRRPTGLTDSARVRLLQPSRYCLENFLLDIDILTDLSRNDQYSDKPKATPTEMRDVMKGLAMAQLNEYVARTAFVNMGLEKVAFQMEAVRKPDSGAIASALHAQVTRISEQLRVLEGGGFEGRFEEEFEKAKKELEPIWEEKWRERCNGKLLLEEMRREGHFKGDLLKLKKAVMAKMRTDGTEAYNSLKSALTCLIGGRS